MHLEAAELLSEVKKALRCTEPARLGADAKLIYDLIHDNDLSRKGVAVLTDLPYLQPSSTDGIMDTLTSAIGIQRVNLQTIFDSRGNVYRVW